MRNRKYIILIYIILQTIISSAKVKDKTAQFSHFFVENQVKGCFILFDLQSGDLTISNPERCNESFLPASTFKIFNALTALETKVAPNKDFVLKWDGTDYGNFIWNRDHTLESAFKASAVWYYKEMARRIGEERMQFWIDKTKYGNRNIGGGIDQFWLSGELKISPKEQTQILAKLVENKLLFSKQNQQTVKGMMIEKETTNYLFGAKTGWAILPDGKNIGWLVGFICKEGKWFTFATNIESINPDNDFVLSRRKITECILTEMELDE